jgi:hypothetical protein
MYKQKLIKIIGKEAYNNAFPCIKDLINNGILLDRFTEACSKPNRQEVSFFLAAWFKHIGLTIEDYQEWLIDYSVDVLSVISSSKPSKIRHSTKSAIKYIHKSDAPFVCNCEHNIFKASCSKDCVIYEKMHDIYLVNFQKKQKLLEKFKNRSSDETALMKTYQSKKEQYKEQFEKSLSLIKQYLDQGHKKKEIVKMLNDKGYKTLMGREWKLGYISNIAVKYNLNPEHIKRKKRSKRDTTV